MYPSVHSQKGPLSSITSTMACSPEMLEWLSPPTSAAIMTASCHTGQYLDTENIHPDSTSSEAVPEGLEGSAVRGKKRKCRAPMLPGDMVDTSSSCCSVLQCVESFCNGSSDLQTLQEEQAIIRTGGKQGRSEFIRGHIPLIKPPKNGGAMITGRQLVCNALLCKVFGVPNNCIQDRKNNPGSSASKR